MKLNKKVRYGLRAMIEICENKSSTGILQKEISAAQNIPLKYLDVIITGLRNAGLITNYSGKSSGYVLSRNPDKISVYDIYRAFEPEFCLVDCSKPSNDCILIKNCTAKDFWVEMNQMITNSMKSYTLNQFV